MLNKESLTPLFKHFDKCNTYPKKEIYIMATLERGRITARVSLIVEETLKEAAEMTGMLVNQFMVQASLAKAKEIIDRERFVKISFADAELILKTLDRPPQPNAALVGLFERHKEFTNVLHGTVRQKRQKA